VAPSEATPKAKPAAVKALELDGTLAHAHAALALAAWAEWDWETSEREYRRTIELNPNLAGPRGAYSEILMALRRPEEAMAQIERALQLDPLNPNNLARSLAGLFGGGLPERPGISATWRLSARPRTLWRTAAPARACRTAAYLLHGGTMRFMRA
jgi:tetratricopeptide (TPR) repeat protein